MSMRLRLFLILVLATGAVWASAVVWTRERTLAHVERVLDARLAEAARMVASLVAEGRAGLGAAADLAAPATGAGYEHRLSCQIWALDGGLLGRSQGAPEGRLSPVPSGFSTSVVEGQAWRVYAAEDPDRGIRVLVADTVAMRQALAGSIVAGLVLPAALVLPALLALIWLSLGRGLAPLDRLARALAARPATDLAPLPDGPAPREVRPLIAGLNGLMARVAAAREGERIFAAFAAHELRTPLSGLRAQAQVAALAPDAATRDRALAQIARAVDRTDRMVRQLLDLAAMESGGETPVESPAPLAAVIAGAIEDARPLAASRGVRLLAPPSGAGAPPGECPVAMPVARPLLLATALRNLLENAVAAAPPGSAVTVEAAAPDAGTPGGATLRVRDEGPGIPADELPGITRRFVRGRGATGPGSGLGLAIVALAAERMGARLALAPAPGGGLVAEIALPAAHAPQSPAVRSA